MRCKEYLAANIHALLVMLSRSGSKQVETSKYA